MTGTEDGAGLGTPRAVEQAYKTHKNRLVTLATALTGDQATAEDAVHDVFAQLLRGNGRSLDGSNIAGYLTVCVRHRAFRLWRVGRRMNLAPSQRSEWHPAPNADPAAAAERHEEASRLLALAAALPAKLREAISLRIWGDLTFEAIAELQGTSKSMAHERCCQALLRLRHGLDNLDKENADVR